MPTKRHSPNQRGEGAPRANAHGFRASSMVVESFEGISKAILVVADSLSSRLIVCGQRGRGLIRTALLGSVSHALASHAIHPVLIVHETPTGDPEGNS